MGNVKAAFGKVKITPEETAPLQGYDPDINIADPDKDILDDLYARIAILDDGACRTVIVSLDACLTNEEIVKVPLNGDSTPDREFVATLPAGTRFSWAKAAETEEEHITVNATHTHSAPVHFNGKYTIRVERKIRELLERLVPVKLSVAAGKSAISAFRRPFLQPDYNVAVDQTLHVLLFENMNGEPIGSFVNYAVHPTGLIDPGDPAPHRRVSADNVGLAMSDWEEAQGNGFISLFLQGFSGDVCPIYGHNGEEQETYPLIKEGAHRFYQDIVKTLGSRHSISANPFGTAAHRFQLPTKNGFYRSELDITLMAIRIGELAILSVSGEVFNGYVNKIRKHFPDNIIMLSGLANGYSGYVPTQEAFQDGKGGYEMGTTPFTEEAEAIFVDESVRLLKRLLLTK